MFSVVVVVLMKGHTLVNTLPWRALTDFLFLPFKETSSVKFRVQTGWGVGK